MMKKMMRMSTWSINYCTISSLWITLQQVRDGIIYIIYIHCVHASCLFWAVPTIYWKPSSFFNLQWQISSEHQEYQCTSRKWGIRFTTTTSCWYNLISCSFFSVRYIVMLQSFMFAWSQQSYYVLVAWYVGPKKFTLSELKNATHNFSEENLIGKGGFCTVHRVLVCLVHHFIISKWSL